MSSDDKNRPPKRVPIEAKRRVTVRDGEARHTPERLKTKGSKLTPSSRAWLERQLSDPYVQKAKREGWRSRAAFKLSEIDEKTALVKKGARVVDLGAAPGGAFCGKVFQGGAEAAILARLKQGFDKVKHLKPPASRKESPELFVVAQGRKPKT